MLALTVDSVQDLDLLDDHLEYHLSAGVDLIVVGGPEPSSEAIRERLGRFQSRNVTFEPLDRADAATSSERLRRLALDRGAEWIIESDADEFWWPRASSLKAVLDPIPARYTTVQALVREFRPSPDDGAPFMDRMTVRTSLLHPDAHREPLATALRPVHRVRGGELIDAGDIRSVPLRAWYPIEVFRIRRRDSAPAAVGDEQMRAGLAAGSLVEDLRLRDYLRALRQGAAPSLLQTPTIVDEASHAIECAAIGEIDLAGLDRHIRELEDRISNLEQRFWPRVVRRLSRMTRGATES